MIQRVQTLYLLLAGVLVLLILLLPLAHFSDATGIQYKYMNNGLWQSEETGWRQLQSTFLITITGIVTILTLLVSIFSFKKRILQIKISWAAIALSLILGLEVFLLPKGAASKANLLYNGIPWAQIFPWIAIVLIVLSIRAIKKDDNLVKSADRLR